MGGEATAPAQHYKALMTKMLSEDGTTTLSAEEFVEHITVQDRGAVDGPEVGAVAPGLRAPDQTGRQRTLGDLYGPAGLLLVFVRSVYWCAYCRNQLAELNGSYEDVRAAGVEVAVVAPDDAERVAEFCDRFSPGFPILCDADGAIVSAYALTNPNVVGAPHVTSEHVPFPGQFLIARDGRIVDKSFTGDLRRRASATTLVSRHVGPTGGPAARIEHDAGAFVVSLSTAEAFNAIDIGLRVDVEPAPGWHVYAPGCPDNYRALRVDVEGEVLDGVEIEYPGSELRRFEALAEDARVYSEPVAVHGRVRIRWRALLPPWKSLQGLSDVDFMHPDVGSHPLTVRIGYQACADTTCLAPATAEVALPLELYEHVPRTADLRPRFD